MILSVNNAFCTQNLPARTAVKCGKRRSDFLFRIGFRSLLPPTCKYFVRMMVVMTMFMCVMLMVVAMLMSAVVIVLVMSATTFFVMIVVMMSATASVIILVFMSVTVLAFCFFRKAVKLRFQGVSTRSYLKNFLAGKLVPIGSDDRS